MSDENQAISVLLPTASVAVFSQDKDTLDSGAALPNDWRFARVSVSTLKGDVDTTITTYQDQTSPDLLIIQTDTIDDAFTGKLEELSGVCAEGTAAIVVGPVNDVYLYRKLIGMGVSDYLVKPLNPQMLGDVVAKTLIEKLGVTDSRLVAFIGAKGGVGTTLLAEMSASSLSELYAQKVMLLDGAGGWSSLSVGMNFEPSTTTAEAARVALAGDEDSLNRMMHKASDKLQVLASGGDSMLDDSIPQESFEGMIDFIMQKHPVVLADLSSTENALKKTVLSRANIIFLVVSPSLPSIRLGRSLMKEIKELRGGDLDDVHIILNQQGIFGKNDVPYNMIETGLEQSVAAQISFDPAVFVRCEADGKKITDDKTAMLLLEKSFLPYLSKVLNIHAVLNQKKKGMLDGILTSFKS